MGADFDSLPSSIQDLPPKWAHFCLRIERFLSTELECDLSGKTLIVGCSGGADSTALLLALHWLIRKNNGRVSVVHLNHGLRPEAVEDADFVRLLCEKLGLECIVRNVDVAALAQTTGVGLEEAGRNARYALFAEALAEQDGDAIALAHHLGDLAEDVIMRLTRGTGWPGLSGMTGYDRKRRLIRPFILTPKSDLIELLSDLGVQWREDCSNSDELWKRNRVRHTILPLFMEENPNFFEAIARLWRVGRQDADFWDEQTADTCDLLSNERLHRAHKTLRLRLYKASLDSLGRGQVLAETLFKLDSAWIEKRIGSMFQFPGDKTALITAAGVLFSTKD
ncbi:tRNA lysidine(34) synthetase TilS [Pseudodesulfovibrio sp.]|uniref:tRNA lysidine(34) synthetase TilS n=1 Tax=unclassified Pseudodesulfovibrio TaxID=2661612 RepID=UPI003B00B1DD